uniref:Trehalase n=1 Tax=Ditylenchus dipsaci TaxID=166011 RepID=A0A915E8J5_9BILA
MACSPIQKAYLIALVGAAMSGSSTLLRFYFVTGFTHFVSGLFCVLYLSIIVALWMRSPILFVPFLALQTLAIVLLYIYATYVLFIAVFWPDYFSQNPYVARMNERTARILVLISCVIFYFVSTIDTIFFMIVYQAFKFVKSEKTILQISKDEMSIVENINFKELDVQEHNRGDQTFWLVTGYHAGIRADKRSGADIGYAKQHLSSFSQQGSSVNLFYEDFFQLNCSIPICEGKLSQIYCTGYIIAASWYFGFQDTCPGSKLRFEPETVLLNFNSFARPLQREGFKRFCEENFEQVPFLKPAVLIDWKEQPKLFEKITDVKMKKMAVSLNQIWPQLSREFVSDVHDNQDRYPVLSVPNRFVILEGFSKCTFIGTLIGYLRALGLLFCDMFDTARGILENFAHILKHKSYIPNSGNIGLSRRSQPPLFTQMIWDFYQDFDGNKKDFLKEFLPSAEKELEWWLTNRTVLVNRPGGTKLTLYQYKAETNCPRPENFLEDYQLGMQSGMDTEFYWSSIASACESGLDFSTRWFSINGTHAASREGIETNQVVPVDLNVFMVLNYRTLAWFFREELGDESKYEKYSLLADHLQAAINELLLDSETQVWFDYDLHSRQLRKGFYPSNVFPLLLNQTANGYCTQILSYLQGLGVFNFKGGIPQGGKAKDLAKQSADAFLTTVYNGLMNPIKGYPAQVWEKYDIRFDDGRSGFGGEYPVQTGFGWTNGAVLEFIRMFYTHNDKHHRNQHQISGKPFNSAIVLIGLALCVLFAFMMFVVQFVWKSRERAVSAAHFWDCQRFEVNDTRLQRDSEHKLLLNTSCDDDSSGNSD